MNLHNLRGATSRWIWANARARNGHTLGDHLWFIDEGVPPEPSTPADMANVPNRWWTPERFRWYPYCETLRAFFTHGWVRPLCNKTSRSTRPYVEMAWRLPIQCCRDCQRIAAERGIIGHTQSMIQETSENHRMIQTERSEWERNRIR